MYAIVEDSGTQIRMTEGEVIDIDLRDLGEKAKTVTFDRVLLVSDTNKKSAAKVGQPYLDGASVKADVLDQIKDDKIDVIKFKRRKGYKRKQGHRQGYLRVRVSKITAA
ncbi:MAG: 50S ribosomal protein L21 [Phycisphaerales bacterium]|nr:50S ribosomal protein L21 [Phycisphaerales bacterium]